MSDRYVAETIEYARNHPLVGVGMPVDIFDNSTLDEWIGEGIIVHMYWSNYYYQYICDVRGVNCVWPCVMAGRLEPLRRTHGGWIVAVLG